MQISDVRVKLIENAEDRLRAVCSVTFDEEFVVRDVKVVDGTNGLFVAMPSRKLSVHCPSCRHKNHLRARFCNECGAKLPATRASADANGRVRLHRDIAHPINPAFREMVQAKVIEFYKSEFEASQLPGYKPAAEEELDESPAGPVAPAHPADPVEVTQEMTEYDALIAGLKSGGHDDDNRGNRAPQGPRPPQRGPAPQGPRQGGDRRGDGRGRSGGGRGGEARRDRGGDRSGPRPDQRRGRGPGGPPAPAPQRERVEGEKPAPVHYEFADDVDEPTVATAPAPQPRPAPESRPAASRPASAPRSEAPPAPRREPPRESRREPAPPPPPAPRPAVDDDGDSFGAGIL